MSKKKTNRCTGDILAIPLGDGSFAFAQVLRDPLLAFFSLRSNVITHADEIVQSSVLFVVPVMNYAIRDGVWMVVGNSAIGSSLQKEPLFFKKDAVSGDLSIYKDSTAEEWPATKEECLGLECAAVWEPEHVEDRLRDYFAGVPNKWVECLKP